MSTERLFKVTAADTSGNVIEWYVEAAPGKLAYFTEQQARSLLVWSLRTGKLSDLRAGEIAEPVSPWKVTDEPDYFLEDFDVPVVGFLRRHHNEQWLDDVPVVAALACHGSVSRLPTYNPRVRAKAAFVPVV
jgi:hypothetical protein